MSVDDRCADLTTTDRFTLVPGCKVFIDLPYLRS